MIAGRFGADQLELRGDVLGGKFPAAGADTAAFQQVARKKLHVRAEARTQDLSGLRKRRDGEEQHRDVEHAPLRAQ